MRKYTSILSMSFLVLRMDEVERLSDLVDIPYPQHPHCATILILDTSASMEGYKINELNEGLAIFAAELMMDELARKRIEIAILSFGEAVTKVCDFTSITEFTPPVLKAGGFTPMGEAILTAISMIEVRKQEYREFGIDYYRPWIFLITDGQPTDMRSGDERWNEVITAIHTGEAEQKFLFWALGVDQANFTVLRALSPPGRIPLQLNETRFADMFVWLSKSLSKISDSMIGERIILENPAGPDGWGSIPL